MCFKFLKDGKWNSISTRENCYLYFEKVTRKEKLKIAARPQQPKYSPSNIHSESNKTEECIALKEGNDIKINNAPNHIHMIDSSSHKEEEIALTSKNSVDKRRSNNRGRRTKMNKYKQRTS